MPMSATHEYVDPADLAGVNERVRAWSAEGEPTRPVRIERVVVSADAIDALTDIVRALSGEGPTMLLVDRTPMVRGDSDLKSLIRDRLDAAVPLTVRTVPDNPTEHFHAELRWADRVANELKQYAAIVSVGSGSVTDVAKYARHLLVEGGRTSPLPMICFPTAASVTAYTSALAVLAVDGVKRTLRSRAPDAVICDLPTLASAPRPMTLAGFGDMLARSVAYGDWFLAGQLGMDQGFSDVPQRLLTYSELAMIRDAERIAAADPSAIKTLCEGLLLAGMAMSIVDQTAPVSGWEHVISHYLDLTAAAEGRKSALHGEQVGVATLVAARAYERAWPVIDLDRILADVDLPSTHRAVRKRFAHLDPTGELTAEVWRDLETKLLRWNAATNERAGFVDRKRSGEFDAFMLANVRPSDAVADALTRATAPLRFAELSQPVPPETARDAVLASHLIRARFTLGDLLSHTGWLDENAIDRHGLLT